MTIFIRLLSRRWWIPSLIVIAAIATMSRLGIWQLDRLAARRIYNSRVRAQQSQEILDLNDNPDQQDLYQMEYRRAIVSGQYLPMDEIVLRNQAWRGELGSQLFTPLLIEGSEVAILVQRGWIPEDKSARELRKEYVQKGIVEVSGVFRRAETDFGVSKDEIPATREDQERADAWNQLDLNAIEAQMEIALLPVYLQRIPERAETASPIAIVHSLELSEGSHLGYAWQWFLFALVLAIGYPIYVKHEEEKL